MTQRVFLAVVGIWLLWVPALAGERASEGEKGAEKGSLELRVLQLEDEIAQLRQLISELREELHGERNDPAGEVESSEQVVASSSSSGGFSKVPEATPQPSSPDPNSMRLYWSDGIRMESADRNVRLQIGGRIQHDWGFHYDDNLNLPAGALVDGAEFRRSRIYLGGEVGRVDFKAEYDFAGGRVGLTDVYVGLSDLPGLGDLRIGHFKEPFGLEELTSSRHLTFLERSLGTEAFAPSRNVGVMLSNTVLEDRLHWAAGFFKDANSGGLALGDGNYSFTGRLAGTPWKGGESRLLHLGLDYSHRDAPSDSLSFGARPEGHLAPDLIGTGTFAADSDDRVGLEGALQVDRFSVQTEFVHTSVNSPVAGDPSFSSFYVQGSFFLTADSRRYRPGEAAYDRVRPSRSFLGGEGGPGAWEVAARYSQLDLQDGFVLGGKEKNFTLGLNWYLNRSTRFMFNLVHADPELSGSLNVLQSRFQIDF